MATSEETLTEAPKDQTKETKDIRGDVAYTYVNHSQVSASQWDIRVAFGEVIPTGKVEPRMGVVMSLHHAKVFVAAFSEVLEKIESAVGKISSPSKPSRITS